RRAGPGPGQRLRVRRPGLPLAQRRRRGRHQVALQRLPVLPRRPVPEGRMKTNGTKASPATLPVVRCAIYTRKSTEDGLEQQFNSLDAQRESAEAYVKSQAGEGWTCLPERYDDGGYTGGHMGRPGLRRLLADIEAGNVRFVVLS